LPGMDDLENAVEDVKLISAMTDEPRPTKPWTLPSTTEVSQICEIFHTERLILISSFSFFLHIVAGEGIYT
jgi:hypothetical protein